MSHRVYLKSENKNTDVELKYAAIVSQVRKQLRSIKENGISFGFLKYLNPLTADELRIIPVPEISFNYLGQFNRSKSEAYKLEQGINLQERNSLIKRTCLLEFTSGIMDGKLILSIAYSRKFDLEKTITSLAASFMENLQRIIAGLLETEAAELSAPATGSQGIGLDQEQFNRLLDELGEEQK